MAVSEPMSMFLRGLGLLLVLVLVAAVTSSVIVGRAADELEERLATYTARGEPMSFAEVFAPTLPDAVNGFVLAKQLTSQDERETRSPCEPETWSPEGPAMHNAARAIRAGESPTAHAEFVHALGERGLLLEHARDAARGEGWTLPLPRVPGAGDSRELRGAVHGALLLVTSACVAADLGDLELADSDLTAALALASQPLERGMLIHYAYWVSLERDTLNVLERLLARHGEEQFPRTLASIGAREPRALLRRALVHERLYGLTICGLAPVPPGWESYVISSQTGQGSLGFLGSRWIRWNAAVYARTFDHVLARIDDPTPITAPAELEQELSNISSVAVLARVITPSLGSLFELAHESWGRRERILKAAGR